ncbi:SMI1/KNR4 family protein [Desnuesiella massiliensis]|uniref:SMI1/KNR4 family protein n=1 Tax=Desnuesiella massiliensis TaxID=1650662 RepID=UPI0006E3F126|nr:SMI1/KNR4 family protein [Desnuesiella massiliensis]
MSNCDYGDLVNKWNEILVKINFVGGKTRELIMEPPATKSEIEEKENSLGFSLPDSFKEVLLNFSKHVELNWSLPKEANLPYEFKEIFSGEIGWSLEWIEDLNILAEELEYSHGYDEPDLRNKLQFFQVGNGDILAFDVPQNSSESIVYWSHEGAGVFYIADNFISYIKKITDLYCVGSEIWQLEPFLDEKGLNTNSEVSGYWKEWFARFTTISFEEASRDLDSLIEYIEFHGQIGKKEQDAFNAFDKDIIFKKVLHRLAVIDHCQKEILYKVLGEVLGTHISIWVRSLWSKESKINPLTRTYLTAMCLAREEALSIVLPYANKMITQGAYVYEIKDHLAYLRNNRIINWMKEYVPNTKDNDQWADLFACSHPSWNDVTEWFKMGGKYRKIVLRALEHMVDSWTSSYIKGNFKISDKPHKQQVINALEEMKISELLKSKKEVYDKIINNIDLLL